MDTYISMISEVGFPIIVSLYLLYRIEGKLDVMIESLQTLPERINE